MTGYSEQPANLKRFSVISGTSNSMDINPTVQHGNKINELAFLITNRYLKINSVNNACSWIRVSIMKNFTIHFNST